MELCITCLWGMVVTTAGDTECSADVHTSGGKQEGGGGAADIIDVDKHDAKATPVRCGTEPLLPDARR
eukprot:jgi/Tetstr1/438040/TSEL_026666.t1